MNKDDEWDIDEDYMVLYSLEELEALPGYQMAYEYDVEADPVVAVCGEYQLRWKTPCALPDHTGHQHGWIGRTRDGRRVLVGGDCAAHHIPDIENMARKATTNKKIRDYRDEIAATLSKVDEIRRQKQWLWDRPNGGSWLAGNQSKYKLLPPAVRKNLEQRARTNNVLIHEYRELSETEKNTLRAMGTGMASSSGSFDGERRLVGRLAGLEVVKRQFKNEADLIEMHLVEMELGFDPKKGNIRYKVWADWCRDIPKQLEALDGLIREGTRFFTAENITLIRDNIAIGSDARMEMARVRFDLYTVPYIPGLSGNDESQVA